MYLYIYLLWKEHSLCVCVVSAHVSVGVSPDHSPPTFSETGLSLNLTFISLARLAGQ